jgi:hypothetical protein
MGRVLKALRFFKFKIYFVILILSFFGGGFYLILNRFIASYKIP